MAYKFTEWKARHRHRSDITSLVTHLTREATIDGQPRSAVDVLAKILADGVIKGSTWQTGGFIVGNRPAVCFQAAPLMGLAENIRYQEKLGSEGGRVRYRGVGLAFNKWYAFGLGARPVIYESTEIAKRLLPANEWWRIVDLDFSDIDAITDWSHEREWRAPDDFRFQLEKATLLVNGTPEYRQLLERVPMEILRQVNGITVLVHAIA